MSMVDISEVGLRPRARAPLGAALALALALASWSAPSRASEPQPTLFEELGVDLNMLGQNLEDRAPAWVDVTMDGQPEAVWIGRQSMEYLALPEGGEPELRPVTIDAKQLGQGPRATQNILPLDFDDDGVQDLFLTGAHPLLFRQVSPEVLKVHKFPMPSIPDVTFFDIAVADFNSDGLPDIVLATAIVATERLIRRGYEDIVLMNLGDGRFESHILEPSREGFTNGLTIADMDGDRRPDIIESINYSHVVGASRILLNRTPPGARVPVFEPTDQSFDTGTHGMGACAADFNQDGMLDIYNTSVGLDQLSIGQPDGSFADESFARGLFHHWGDLGMRSQWSPTFEDFNLDGRLDILVRQGGFGAGTAQSEIGPGVTETGKDLLYLQREDGTIVRDFPPYTVVPGSMGRQAVAGDANGDGRPDIAFGGGRGAANFWLNNTPVPEGGSVLTVRLAPTVSASPATGAWVEAVCGGQKLWRTLTSGGKMGGQAAFDMYFAWPTCDEEIQLTVGWPSGATTEHTVASGVTLAQVGEPEWWSASEELPGHVFVSPGSIGADEVCVGVTADGPWDCCADLVDGCHLELATDKDLRAVARVDGQLPVALMNRSSEWKVMVTPSPATPGQEAEIHLLHLGDKERFLENEPSIFFGDPLNYASASELDMEHQTKTVTVMVPEDATSLPVSLFCAQGCNNVESEYPQVTWTLDVGGSLDPRWIRADSYPYQIVGSETEFWDWTGYIMGRSKVTQQDFAEYTRLYRPDGTEVEYAAIRTPSSLSRIRMSVSHAELQGADTLTAIDTLSGYQVEFPVNSDIDLEEATSRIVDIEEGMLWHRLVDNGDLGWIFMQLKDEDGLTVSPALDMVRIEVEGGEVLKQPSMRHGAYDMVATIRTMDCEENGGLIRVVTADDREISTHPFSCRPEGLPEVDLGLSWTEVREADEGTSQATHTVQVHASNPHNEVLGSDAKVDLVITGGVQVDIKRLRDNGDIDVDIRADPGQHTMEIEVFLNDQELDKLSVEVDIPIEPELDVPDATPDAGGSDVSAPADVSDLSAEPAASSESRGGGCSGGGQSTAPLALLLLALWGWPRTRERTP